MKKYTKTEFQKGSFEDDLSLERIRWLSDDEANNLLLGYDPSEPELPKIQMFDQKSNRFDQQSAISSTPDAWATSTCRG